MHRRSRVAIVTDPRRQDALAQAMHLLGDAWPDVPEHGTVVKINLVSHQDQRASSHATTVGAVADFLYARGAAELTIAEGATDATAGFERLGHRRMFWKRPVRFFDINRDETDWTTFRTRATDGSSHETRVSTTMANAGLYVSVALAKTHVNTMLTASMKNQMSCVHPHERIRMHGYAPGGNGFTGFKKHVVQWLKGDGPAVAWATTTLGRARQVPLQLESIAGRLRWDRLRPPRREFVKSIAALHVNLARLNTLIGPRLAVVDGFGAMDGEGPRFGRARNFGWVVVGNDPVAVDGVVARLMGMNVGDIGYLVLAERLGLGNLAPKKIELVGDPLDSLARRCRLHSHAPLHRLWSKALPEIGETDAEPLRGHHLGTRPAASRQATGAKHEDARAGS